MKALRILSLGLGLVSLVGCTTFEPHPIAPSDEMRGPGLFSGPEGKFNIPLFDSEKSEDHQTLNDLKLDNDNKTYERGY